MRSLFILGCLLFTNSYAQNAYKKTITVGGTLELSMEAFQVEHNEIYKIYQLKGDSWMTFKDKANNTLAIHSFSDDAAKLVVESNGIKTDIFVSLPIFINYPTKMLISGIDGGIVKIDVYEKK